MIEDRVNSGNYASAEEVVTVALHGLSAVESFGDFAPGELERLIAQGENSGPPIPYETFRENMRAYKEAFRAARM
jgi:Arc/MetJ-type ribon-helix-helix transcriptional regulator